MKEQQAQTTSLVPAFIGKDEMNLAEYPFSLLTHRIPPNRKTYSLTQHIVDSQGRMIKQNWSILGSDKYGLPTPYDDDVLLALLYCYKDQHFQGRKIHFTLYRLCQIMQKSLSKREYDRIRDSLNRLTSTTIAAINCFYDNAAKSWVSETFHLFDRYKLYQEQKRHGAPLPLSFIEMSEVFARSVAIANYIKDIDLKTYYSLDLPISKRLFRYLDKNRYNKSRYEEAVMKIARKLPLNYTYPSQVKQKLARAHEELLQKQYLADVSYRSTQQGEEKVSYAFAEREVSVDKKPIIDVSIARQLVLDFYSRLTGSLTLTYSPTSKELALAEEYITTYGPEGAAAVVRHALDAARAAGFPIQKFGGTKHMLPQALAAWKKHAAMIAERETEREMRELEEYRRQMRKQLAEVMDTLSPQDLEVLENKAKAQLDAQEHDFGARLMVTMKRDELLLYEHLGYDIWPKLAGQLRERLESRVFNEAIQSCQLECIEGDTLIVSAPNKGVKELLMQHYTDLIEELAYKQGKHYRIHILTRGKSS
jgi:plasmid replication initiation protein